ncbi:MAG: OmpA family protein [Desulfonatronovibrionaceae bacterium]
MNKIKITGILTLLAALMLTAAASYAQAETRTVIEPRAENFIYFVDNSGSMGFEFEESGLKKSVVARDVLRTINDELPVLDADFGVYSYAPYKEYRDAQEMDVQDIDQALQDIPTDFEIFKRQTPMGSGMLDLNGPLDSLRDRISVVMVTDGESNLGPDPRDVLQDLYSQYGKRLCFHFISLAQTPEEKAMVEDLAGLSPCSVVEGAHEMGKEFVRADFMKKVFYHTREVAVDPEPAPEPEPEPEPEPAEEVIVFSNINFEFDSARIRSEYAEILREAADIIKDRQDKKVLVEGHTCSIGPESYNLGLSKRRAQSVADFLEEEGVSQDRLETHGYGELKPKFDNSTREGRALNRRVEMRLQ